MPNAYKNNASALIPKPKGQAGRKDKGYKLQDAMGLQDNKVKYDRVLVCRAKTTSHRC